MMNPIERLQAELQLPRSARFDLSEPKRSDGLWILTIEKSTGYVIEVEWRARRGFGIAAGRDLDFGTGVHELLASLDATKRRVAELYRSERETDPSTPISLRDLRVLSGATQSALAGLLAVTNGLVAQRESSPISSMKVQTLVQVVEALGGVLDIVVKLPDREPRTLKLS
jgi:hypothetical protein